MISSKGDMYPTPTIAEAATIADVLDGIGIYEDAELLDEYIKKAIQNQGDMIKVAAFWSDIWKRLKGRTKRLFIKEFREAHDAAQKVQEELTERVETLNEKFAKISQALKTYQLADWYRELNTFPGGDALLTESGFQDTYGRFMQAILGAKETIERQKETPEVDKVFGPSTKEEGVEEVGEWSPVVRRQPAVEEHFEGGKIRVQLSWWNRWAKKHLKRIPDEKGRVIFKVMPTIRNEKGEATQQTPVNLEQGMGEGFWQVTDRDSGYVYLEKVAPTEIKAPTAIPTGEEAFKKEPELPKPSLEEDEAPKEPSEMAPEIEPEVFEEEVGSEFVEPEVPEEVVEPEIKEPSKEPTEEEKRKEEIEGIEAEKGGLEALEGTTWIRYNQNARKDLKGMYRPVRKVRPEVHDIITDEKLIDYLNNLWVKRHSPTQKGVELESDDMSGIRLANKRFTRMYRVMELLDK